MELDLEKLAREIVTMAYNASGAALMGKPTQRIEDLRRRFDDIQVGDLVVETSTALMDGRRGEKYYRPALDAVGYLIKVTWEPIVFEGDPDFIWDETVEGKPHPTEKCVYIRT
jgi:L-ascorbate metabolism protein UlaG (beta-lactamase superfamily)